MRDVVGHLLEAAHQRLDAVEHGVDVERQAVDLVAGAGDRQPIGQVAGHDALRFLRDRVDPPQDAPADEEAAAEPEHQHRRHRPAPGGGDDLVDALAFLDVAPDQQVKTAGQLRHQHQRVMLGAFGRVEPPIGGLDPAFLVEDARLERGDVAGDPLAERGGEQVEARARPARADLDHLADAHDAAALVLFGEARDLGIDRGGDLLGDQAARIEGEEEQQQRRVQREQHQIDERQAERRRAEKLTERRHGSCILRPEWYGEAAA